MELMLLAAGLAVVMDWTAVTVGIIAGLFGTLGVAGTIYGIRRQFSGSARTSSGDGLLALTEAFMKIQQDENGRERAENNRLRERIAVLESKVSELESGWAAEKELRRGLELENARLKAERS